MTEPAPPPGGDPTRSAAAPDPAGPTPGTRPASPWAMPGARPDEGPSAPPEPGGWATPGAYPGNAPAPGGGWATPGSPPVGGGWAPMSPAAGPRPGPVPPPPREPARPPKRVDPVPGTPFGVVHLDVPPVTSGLAVGSLVTGIAAILVSFLVLCFGIAGPDYGGAWAAGAFTVLGGLAGTAAIVGGLLARRQIRRPAPPPAVRFTGRGLAVAGLSCGAVGLLLSVLGLGVALLVQLT